MDAAAVELYKIKIKEKTKHNSYGDTAKLTTLIGKSNK